MRLHRRVRGARRPERLLDDRRRPRRSPAATSPLTSRKRWQTLVPGSGRTPIETASSADAAGVGMQQRRAAARRPRPRRRPRAAPRTRPATSRGGRAGRRARRRGDRGDDVAGVARHVGEHALVARPGSRSGPRSATSSGVSATQPSGTRRRVDATRTRACGCGERTNAACSMPGPLDVDRVALRAGHARVDADRAAHAASASTARRTSTAIDPPPVRRPSRARRRSARSRSA